jgi:hypothetical protein
MSREKKNVNMTLGVSRKALEGRVIFACRNCGAPGTYQDAPSIRDGWPACYDPSRHSQPVGDICPQCGARRPDDLNKGELQASMPLWLWHAILGFKWLLIRCRRVINSLQPST